MNEVTQIHLGRQSFTISVAAHKQLQAYLRAISQHGGKEVADEVELRMAELLIEHGVDGDKVVHEEDIKYLQEQLGKPEEFGEAASDELAGTASAPKRLFRDTHNGMIAGVAAGLGTYFNLDVVIVRLLFILATITGGWGIPLYIILWLLMPEAKTASDHLQMRGKTVTIETIKEVVARADVPGAAGRASNAISGLINRIGRAVLAIIGVATAATGAAMFFGGLASGVYLMIHGGQASNQLIFPIGVRERWLLVCGVAMVVLLASFFILSGVAMIRRKWQTPSWAVAAMAALFLISGGVGWALAFDAAPRIADRVDALHHTQVRQLATFTTLHLAGKSTNYTYEPDAKSYIEVKYFGNYDPSAISSTVNGGTLTVDTTAYADKAVCRFLCLYYDGRVQVIIHAPSLDRVEIVGDNNGSFMTSQPLTKPLTINSEDHTYISAEAAGLDKVVFVSNRQAPYHQIELTPSNQGGAIDRISSDGETIYITHATTIQLITDQTCDQYNPLISVGVAPQTFEVSNLTTSGDKLSSLQSPDQSNFYNCITASPN